ncbi:MAG: c-type cytochrome [Xanthobacteraceae bacterium]|jgi:cytochrome c|nr:c-type cytochrome [Xanthobacteraceae bacterium]
MLGMLGAGSSAQAAADLELGRYLATECTTCHRPGAATAAIPNIYSLAESTFAEVMKGYRDKRLANPVMQNIASRLSDDDIAALAAFFATVKAN